MNVLVDTSVWSLAFRRRAHQLNPAETAVVAELSELIREGRARIIGLIRQELLSGISSAMQYEKLRTALQAFADEPVTTTDHEAAAKAGNAYRAKGISVSLVDILISTVALERSWSVFTTDPDFEAIAKVARLKLHKPRS